MKIDRFKMFSAWFRSLFTKKMVVTRQVFTDGESDIPMEVNLKDVRDQHPPSNATKHLSRYRLRELGEFIMVGVTRKRDRVVYQLYHEGTKKMVFLDKSLFEMLFKSE